MPDISRDDGYDPDRWDAPFIVARDGSRQLEPGVYRRTIASLNNGWLARGGHLALHDDCLSFSPTPLERLLFELQLGDLLAQRIEAALELQALLIGTAQLRGEVVVFAALGGQRGLALELQRQGVLQAGLRGGVVERRQLLLQR